MPAGVYALGGVTERFSCALAPAGWHYTGTASDGAAIEVAADARWAPARVEVRTTLWYVRGGVAGRDLLWVRGSRAGADQVEDSTPAAGMAWRSPALLVVTARALGLAVGTAARVRRVSLATQTLAPLVIEELWRYDGATSYEGVLTVERWTVEDIATGESSEVHLVGDVVVAAPEVELVELDGAPSVVAQPGS